VVRASAVEALGRFEDPRVPEILAAAFHQADGTAVRPAETPKLPGMLSAQANLFGPTGYSPDVATMLRVRAVEALAKTNRAEAVSFLAEVALPKTDADPVETRDIRIAAVRGLASMRRAEAVTALARVLAAEQGRDPAVVARAHLGLVELTGHQIPPDPERWNAVVQAGFEIQPEPNAVQRAINSLKP
jgi:hypothetical protein